MGKPKKVSRGMARRPGQGRPSKQQNPFALSVATAAPISTSTIVGSTVGLQMRSINDRELGAGINVSGSEVFCSVGAGTTNTSSGILVPQGGVVTALHTMMIGPAAAYAYNGATGVSSDLAVLGISYVHHRFTKLRFRYVPSCPTSTLGNLTFAFSSDIRSSCWNGAGTRPSNITTAQLSKLMYSVQTVPWQACSITINLPPRSSAGYFCATAQAFAYTADASTTLVQGALSTPTFAESLHDFQGAFWGQSDSSTLAAGIILGKIVLDYSVDMFSRGALPAGSGGVSLMSDSTFGLRSPDEKDIAAIEYLRSRRTAQAASAAAAVAPRATLNNTDPRACLCDVTWVNGTQVSATNPVPINISQVGGSNDPTTYSMLQVDVRKAGNSAVYATNNGLNTHSV